MDFLAGRFVNHTRGLTLEVPPVPAALHELVEVGGTNRWLARWWAVRQALAPAPTA